MLLGHFFKLLHGCGEKSGRLEGKARMPLNLDVASWIVIKIPKKYGSLNGTLFSVVATIGHR